MSAVGAFPRIITLKEESGLLPEGFFAQSRNSLNQGRVSLVRMVKKNDVPDLGRRCAIGAGVNEHLYSVIEGWEHGDTRNPVAEASFEEPRNKLSPGQASWDR